MRPRNLDLMLAVIVAALNIGWALLPDHILLVGAVLALPLVLVLPGYTLTQILFRERSLDVPNSLLFSLGLSLAIDILGGLLLNILPVGLKAISWAALLGLLTVIFSLLAAYLRRAGQMSGDRTPRPRRLSISALILFGLAIAIAAFSFLYASLGAARQPYPGFTQLWMLPAAGNGKDCAVSLGVRSFESTSVAYRIELAAGEARVATWSSVVLAPQQEWVRQVPVPPGPAASVAIAAQLYRVDTPGTVYRQVHLVLHSCPTAPYPALVGGYKGTIHDIAANISTTMSLTGIRQSGGGFTGSLAVGAGLQDSGSFRGTVTTAKHLQFTVTDAAGQATVSFEASIDSVGTLSGSYCSLNRQGQCERAGGYGLWSATPVSP